MKINNSNTALHLLDKIDPFQFRICQDKDHSPQEYVTQVGLSVSENFPKIASRFKEKIQYISDPFHKAYVAALSKLGSVIDAEPINESGTFISRSTPSETNTIFYDIRTEGKGKDFNIVAVIFFFNKHTNSDKPALAIYIQKNSKGDKEYISETAHKNGCDSMSVIADIFTLILFMKYCELQTKEILPNKKAFHVNCKYVNETNHKIEILDSTWFTTITRSEGFMVGDETGGFLRLQPCGPGLTKKKLIWIWPFEKEGYTRTAKMLNQK